MKKTRMGKFVEIALTRIRGHIISKIILITGLCLLHPVMAQAQAGGGVVVLPFRINTAEPLAHLKTGLQDMLTTRMAEKGLPVIDPDITNKHPKAFQPGLRPGEILALGNSLRANWLIMGSLTQIGEKISLDLKVYDITTGKPPFSVFMVEDDIDRLAEAVDRASTSLYNQISGVVQIESLQVKGNRRVESEAILAVVESQKGEKLDFDLLDEDLRSIYKMGFFKDVTLEAKDGTKGKIITFKVAEKPSIGKIFFEGNKKIKDEDLRKEASIKLYSILDLSEITQSINRLKELYRQKGYYDIVIKDKVLEIPKNEVSLTYEIEEGNKVYVKKIEFIGNDAFDDGDLKDVMETSKKSIFSWITDAGKLDNKRLEFDRHKLISFYSNAGYIRVRVGDPKISWDIEEKGLRITIEIIEGPQYKVGEVKIEGDLILPADALLKNVNIKKEKFYNREVVRKDSMTLREIYSDAGFAYADVSPLTRQDDRNHLVDITYRASKGQKVRIERINITGNTTTRDKVIRRELAVIEGEYFTGSGLKLSTQNLHRLGFFENVEVQTKKGSKEDLVVLDIDVKERPTGNLSLGAGYSAFDNVIGMFKLEENNFFGYGQRVSAALRIGARTQQFDIRFTEPWFLGKPISAGFDIFKWRREYDEYTKDSLGGAVRFGFPLHRLHLDDFTRGSVAYVYDNSDIFDIGENAAREIKEMAGKNVTSSITLGITRDSTDRLFNTSRGSLNRFTFQYAGGLLGGNVAFNKYEVTSAWHFPLFWETVFMVQGRVGYIQGRPEDGTLPIFHKYRIGGINTVRGFESFSISPIDPLTGDKIGGEKKLIFNIEYRFPLLKEQGVIGVVFFDAGNVWREEQDYSITDLRTSVGGGIRWYSPLGPLQIVYGINLDPRGDEESGLMDFAIGGAF